jgi:hypothetical protein
MHDGDASGNRLGELMETHEPPLKRLDIAALCRRDTTTVGRWIKGEVPIPDEAKRILAAYFDVTVEQLMGWDRTPATNGSTAS